MRLSRAGPIFATAWLLAPASAARLEEVLASMDAAAASFRSMTAKIKRTSHTAIINDNSVEYGTIRVAKSPKGMSFLIDFVGPDPKTYVFSGRKAEIYYPKVPIVQEYDLGKHKTLVDQFLLLGFGTAGRDLSRNYTIRLVGEKPVDGTKTFHLELIPKSSEVAEKIRSAELWVASPGGYSVQQKFLERSGNYMLVVYSELKLNEPVPMDSLQLRLPPGVKREFPMK